MRTAAQQYTNLGWVIHPIRPPTQGDKNTGKAPFEPGWQKRTKPRTPYELDKFFQGTGFNIGILCGQASGITIIDIDDANFLKTVTRGLDTSQWVLSARSNETARGHIFFKYVSDLPAQKHHLLGLEVLNNGNNCVLPPSTHYSGGVYQWGPNCPELAQVPDMPAQFKTQLLELFKTEKKLKELFAHGRPCFRKFIDTPEKLHGGDGRRFMVALATELSAAADELRYGNHERDKCLKMTARLVYREEYDPARTDKEINGIDPQKTWKCSTLAQAFPDLCDCAQCKFKQPEAARPPVKEKTRAADLLEVAEALQKQAPVVYDSAGVYWIWADNGYKKIDETDLLIVTKNVLGIRGLTVQKTKNEFLEGVRMTGRERRVLPRPPEWVQFQDRVINFRTSETFSSTPEYFFTSPLPHNLGDSEETPQIDKVFEEWVGQDRKRLLYEILAYALLDDYPIHRIFCLIGSGRNGKGQFMKLLRRFIGINNITSTELERLEESRFETAKLYQKKAVFIGETNFSAISKTNRLKQISGGDVITGEWKRKAPFDFINTAKILIATNSLPVTRDRTDGFYSRWLVVEFPNRFQEGRDLIDPIPEKEFENLGRKCLRILSELLEAGGFNDEGTIEDRARRYEEKSNPVAAFIKTQCTPDPSAWTPLYTLFDSYDNFQNMHGYRTITKKQFELTLLEMGYDRERSSIGDFTGVYISGLKLRAIGGPGVQLHFTQAAPQEPQGEQTSPAPMYEAIPGEEIPDEALHPDQLLDKDIIEAVRVHTGGTMHVKNLQLFIDHYCRTHPYANDKQVIGGRIRLLQQHGWRPRPEK